MKINNETVVEEMEDVGTQQENTKSFGDQEAKRPLCRFHALGRCKFGESCTFSHRMPSSTEHGDDENGEISPGYSVACPYFLSGVCRYGDYCKLRHSKGDLGFHFSLTIHHNDNFIHIFQWFLVAIHKNEDLPSSELICGICYDDIVATGKRFGLLQCDHCYCLDCLRQWRGSTSMEAAVTRSCPACRLKSDFIVPSRKFCIGKEKEQVIHAYKEHLATTKCKYFDGSNGSCQFGRYCFYAHLNREGRDVKLEEFPRECRRKHSCDSLFDSSSLLDPFIFFLDLNYWEDDR